LGIVVPSLEQVSIECLPKDLPDRIEADISGLIEIGDSLLVKDLLVPDGVEILSDPEEVVVVVIAQAVEEEIEEDLEPEVIERGKREEEEAGEEEGVDEEE
jgi:large subunit ribosomal protein L25